MNLDGSSSNQLSLALVTKQLDELNRLFRQSTVQICTYDDTTRHARALGTGVVADLFGCRLVLTAGHVIGAMERDHALGRVFLSVHVDRGSFRLPAHVLKLRSTGGDLGPDAGVIVLHEPDGFAYFNSGNLVPIRASTVRLQNPPVDAMCVVAGYPGIHARTAHLETPRLIETKLENDLVIVVAHVEDSVDGHLWLRADGDPLSLDTADEIELPPLGGMSGGGCWSLSFEPDGRTAKLALQAVHTATARPRLRETPVLHHLRLLATSGLPIASAVRGHWPELTR